MNEEILDSIRDTAELMRGADGVRLSYGVSREQWNKFVDYWHDSQVLRLMALEEKRKWK